MQTFNLNKMQAYPYAERNKNVFFKRPEFKTRLIELHEGGSMPECVMESFVIFVVLEGEAVVSVNDSENRLGTGECLITEPAVISMKTKTGVKIMGVQINKKGD